MKSLLLLGACLASFAAATTATVVQPANNDDGQNRPVVGIVYDIFGRSDDTQGEADKLTVVTQSTGCKWCKKLSPVIRRLKRNGYNVEVIEAADYKGAVEIEGYPTLIFTDGDKPEPVSVVTGYRTYEQITALMRKPETQKLKPSDIRLTPQLPIPERNWRRL